MQIPRPSPRPLFARTVAATVIVLAALAAADVGRASQLLDRNAKNVRLQVSRGGVALVTYRVNGKLRRIRASGAINALHPTLGRAQVAFRLDYSGGRGPFRNACGPYRGPLLAWLVVACTAPDGSHWALQSWQRALPNYGQRPTAQQAAYELRLSH